MTSSDRNPVDVLADEFSARLQRGEQPTIEEYASRYPRYAADIRAVFSSLQVIERVSTQERVAGRFERQTRRLTGSDSATLGDFHIIRELGRGGMGIVYEAEQQSLKRRVALKVLAPHVADSPVQLTRFRREATAAARLHHTNIVPVYGVGEADGLHFFAMQFIDGHTLQELLQGARAAEPTVMLSSSAGDGLTDVSTTLDGTDPLADSGGTAFMLGRTASLSDDPVRETARMIRDVARALAYAHEQGVHHRDIKPGNLLLDGAGTIWVTDFGLARHEGDEAATRTGDIVGTLRYMAPEQFGGTSDGRSDIYSLGLTLYELLTGEPAFGQTRTAELMKIKTTSSPPSPRELVPSLPADLETITLKASALDPAHRYQSAAEMADDLNRFLNDLPIRARRITPVERLWRWSRRNPAVATLSAASFALLLLTATVFAVGNYRTGRALTRAKAEGERARNESRRAEANLAAARAANARAEKNFSMAVAAFEEIMKNVSSRGRAESLAIELDGEELAPPPSVVTQADAELLETLLDFFRMFARENRADLSTQTADALARVGRIQRRLGRLEDAEQSLTDALDVYARLPAARRDHESRLAEARLHRELMEVLADRGDLGGGLQQYHAVRELLDDDNSPAGRFELALALSGFASVPGDLRSAVESVNPRRPRPSIRPGRAGSGFRPEGSSRPRPPGDLLRPPRPPGDSSRPPAPPGRAPRTWMGTDVRSAADEAVAILSDLLEQEPSNREYRLELARAHRRVASLGRLGNDRSTAVAALAAAIEQLTRLVQDSPRSPVYRFELATTLCVRVSGNRIEQAVRSARAVSLARELTGEYPGIAEYQMLLATALQLRNAFRRGEPENEPALQEVVGIFRDLHRRYPEIFEYRLGLCVALRNLSVHQQRDDRQKAAATAREAIALLQSIGSDGQLGPDHRRIVQALLARLAEQTRPPE